MSNFCDKISKKAKDVLDLKNAYLLLIRMNSDKMIYNDVIGNALDILNKLGESIDPNQSIKASDLLQAKNIFGECIESVLEMREIDDKRILSIMEILHTLLFSAYFF